MAVPGLQLAFGEQRWHLLAAAILHSPSNLLQGDCCRSSAVPALPICPPTSAVLSLCHIYIREMRHRSDMHQSFSQYEGLLERHVLHVTGVQLFPY